VEGKSSEEAGGPSYSLTFTSFSRPERQNADWANISQQAEVIGMHR